MIYGTCKGLLASYGIAYADTIHRILPGSFAKMEIDSYGVPVFWHHEFDEPTKVVGKLNSFWVTSRGLEGELRILDGTAWSLIVERIARSVSIGFTFNRRKMKEDSDGILLVDAVDKLFEVTLLPNGYGADDSARIEQVVPATTVPVQNQAAFKEQNAADAAFMAATMARMNLDAAKKKSVADQIEMHNTLARMYTVKPGRTERR